MTFNGTMRSTNGGVVLVMALLVGLGGCTAPPVGPGTSASPSFSVPTQSSADVSSPSASLPSSTSSMTSQAPTTAPSSTSAPTLAPTTAPPATTQLPTTTRPTTAACQIPAGYRNQDVTRIATSNKVIALTFDAGASASGVTTILDVLQRTGTPASFFLTGDFANRYPSAAAAIAAKHPVGNHSMTHPAFTKLSDAQIIDQLSRARTSIIKATGQDPRPWFRFPLGDRNSHVISVVNAQCYVPFRWTVDSLGWKGTSGGMSKQAVIDRVVGGATAGGIILMHVGANPDDGTTLDAAALPAIIDGLKAKGYRFVTLAAAVSPAP